MDVDWSRNTSARSYRGSQSFATFMIIGPVCFFLGLLFAFLPYDFPLLWTSAPVPPPFYDQFETHLRFLHHAPPLIPRVLHITFSVGLGGFCFKLARPSAANVLFDGAALVLYLIGASIYAANIVRGLRAVSAPPWEGGGDGPGAAARDEAGGERGVPHHGPWTGERVLGREDSLRVLSASNTILALVLIGVLVLQAGQWYAERKEADELARFARLDRSARRSSRGNKGAIVDVDADAGELSGTGDGGMTTPASASASATRPATSRSLSPASSSSASLKPPPSNRSSSSRRRTSRGR